MHFVKISGALLVFLGVAHASFFGQGCIDSFTTLTGEAATCFNANGLENIFTSDDTIGAIDSYLKTWCDTTPCSTDTLNATISNITTQCSFEFGTLLFDYPTKFLESFQDEYDSWTKTLCLKDTAANDELCLTYTLDAINSTTNGFSVLGIAELVEQVFENNTIDTDIECSTCAQGLWDEIRTALPSPVRDEFDGTFSKACGASFVGTVPSVIVPFASSSPSKGAATRVSDGALPFWTFVAPALGVAVGYLLVV